MATAKQITAQARKVMRDNGAVLITAADFQDGRLARIQVYFWDENEAVMDVISKEDLVENWPDEGVFLINPAGEKDPEVLTEVRILDGEEDFYIRAVPEDADCDDLGSDVPPVVFMEAVELISQLKERKK